MDIAQKEKSSMFTWYESILKLYSMVQGEIIQIILYCAEKKSVQITQKKSIGGSTKSLNLLYFSLIGICSIDRD